MMRWILCAMMVCALGCTTTPAPKDDATVKETEVSKETKPEDAKPEAKPEEKPEAKPRVALVAQIKEGVEMLKANEHQKFLKRFIHPRDMEKLGPRVDDPKFAEQFAKSKAGAILAIFEAAIANDAALTVSEDATTATIQVPDGIDAPKSDMKLGVVDGKWYIFN